jgi:hypothetical protein
VTNNNLLLVMQRTVFWGCSPGNELVGLCTFSEGSWVRL